MARRLPLTTIRRGWLAGALLSVVLALLAGSRPAPAADTFALPAERRIDWTLAGIPGGIPTRTTICATIDAGTFGDGATDATAAIQEGVSLKL